MTAHALSEADRALVDRLLGEMTLDEQIGNTPGAWRAMVTAFQREALSSRLGIPLLYGVDAVHAHPPGALGRRSGADAHPGHHSRTEPLAASPSC